MMSNRTKAILINAALVIGCVIQLARGYRPIIVFLAGLTMFVVGNTLVFIKARADFRRRNPNHVGRFAMHLPGEKKPTMRDRFLPRERDSHRMDGPR